MILLICLLEWIRHCAWIKLTLPQFCFLGGWKLNDKCTWKMSGRLSGASSVPPELDPRTVHGNILSAFKAIPRILHCFTKTIQKPEISVCRVTSSYGFKSFTLSVTITYIFRLLLKQYICCSPIANCKSIITQTSSARLHVKSHISNYNKSNIFK